MPLIPLTNFINSPLPILCDHVDLPVMHLLLKRTDLLAVQSARWSLRFTLNVSFIHLIGKQNRIRLMFIPAGLHNLSLGIRMAYVILFMNLPHIKWSHKSDSILPISRQFHTRDFRRIKIWWVVFLQNMVKWYNDIQKNAIYNTITCT